MPIVPTYTDTRAHLSSQVGTNPGGVSSTRRDFYPIVGGTEGEAGMNADRRTWDPFAPPPAETAEEPSGEVGVESGGDVELSDQPGDGLDDMRRMDLLDLAEAEGIGAYGTKADLIARIRKHRAG